MSDWKRPVALTMLIGLLISVGLAGPVLAALPPDAQRAHTFQQVIEEAARVLDAPINAVHYKVKAGDCQPFVRVVLEPRSGPGPASCSVIPGKPQCG